MNRPVRLNKVNGTDNKNAPELQGRFYLTAMVGNDAPLTINSFKYQRKISGRVIRCSL